MSDRITLRALLALHYARVSGLADVADVLDLDMQIDDTEEARAWGVAVAMGHPELRRWAGWAVGRLCRPESVGVRAGADLRGAYLRGAWLVGASLVGADLRGAAYAGALFHGADLRGATMSPELREYARAQSAIVDEGAP